MSDMTTDKGHLNGLCKTLGIRPACREQASDEELLLAQQWMKLRARAYSEQAVFDSNKEPSK